MRIPCPRCGGSGRKRAADCDGRPYGSDRCYRCSGSGWVWQIPPAVLDRFARRIADKAAHSRTIRIFRTGHPDRPFCFSRKDDDSYCGYKDPWQLVRGTHCKRCAHRVTYPRPEPAHF